MKRGIMKGMGKKRKMGMKRKKKHGMMKKI